METMMNKAKKLLLMIAGGAAVMMMTTAANAGYYDALGYYHPTCVPGYWAPGPLYPIWVPAVCG